MVLGDSIRTPLFEYPSFADGFAGSPSQPATTENAFFGLYDRASVERHDAWVPPRRRCSAGLNWEQQDGSERERAIQFA